MEHPDLWSSFRQGRDDAAQMHKAAPGDHEPFDFAELRALFDAFDDPADRSTFPAFDTSVEALTDEARALIASRTVRIAAYFEAMMHELRDGMAFRDTATDRAEIVAFLLRQWD